MLSALCVDLETCYERTERRERWMSVNVFRKHTQSRVIVPINRNGKKGKTHPDISTEGRL